MKARVGIQIELNIFRFSFVAALRFCVHVPACSQDDTKEMDFRVRSLC